MLDYGNELVCCSYLGEYGWGGGAGKHEAAVLPMALLAVVAKEMVSKIKSGLSGRSRIPSSVIIMRGSSAPSDSSYQAAKKEIPTGGNTIVGGSMREIFF